MVFDQCFLGKGRVPAPRGATAQDGGGGEGLRGARPCRRPSAGSGVAPNDVVAGAAGRARVDAGAALGLAANTRAGRGFLRPRFQTAHEGLINLGRPARALRHHVGVVNSCVKRTNDWKKGVCVEDGAV